MQQPLEKLSWTAQHEKIPTLTLNMEPRDGWLFAMAPISAAGVSLWHYRELTPGVKTCLTVYAYNVSDRSERSREVCVTGAVPSEERFVDQETPYLRDCAEPPTSDGKVVQELLAKWCEDRSAVCPTTESGPDARDCSFFEEQCPELNADDEQGTIIPVVAAGSKSDGSDHDTVDLKSSGCSVRAGRSARGEAEGGLLALGFALLFLRTRRRTAR